MGPDVPGAEPNVLKCVSGCSGCGAWYSYPSIYLIARVAAGLPWLLHCNRPATGIPTYHVLYIGISVGFDNGNSDFFVTFFRHVFCGKINNYKANFPLSKYKSVYHELHIIASKDMENSHSSPAPAPPWDKIHNPA